MPAKKYYAVEYLSTGSAQMEGSVMLFCRKQMLVKFFERHKLVMAQVTFKASAVPCSRGCARSSKGCGIGLRFDVLLGQPGDADFTARPLALPRVWVYLDQHLRVWQARSTCPGKEMLVVMVLQLELRGASREITFKSVQNLLIGLAMLSLAPHTAVVVLVEVCFELRAIVKMTATSSAPDVSLAARPMSL
jgi:hypothetical protein